ncbi:phage tail tape measure protein [Hymenobacter sp. B81]|uniref:phage tail tape measure protein n=1 Tax=Hymenobacter sp. B81 TaxID=3344878 RepID=UPI0037DD9ECB
MATDKERREIEIVFNGQQANASIKDMAAAAAIMNNQLAKMAADDPRRAELQQDFARLTARITETRAALRTVIQTEEELAEQQAKLAEQTRLQAEANQATVATGQQASASMREMKAAAGVLDAQLQELSADDPGRAAMIRDYQVLQQRIEAAREEVKTYVKSAEELEEEQRQLAAETARLNQENREVVLNGQKVTASFKEMKAAGALLEQQLHELSADDPGRAKLLKDYQDLQKRIDGVKKEMGETAEKGLTMKDALAFAGVTVGLEAAVDLVKEIGTEVVQTVKEFEALREKVNTLTGATGDNLDQLTVGVAGLAKTFNKEYDEVLVASNALSKQMGISQQEALRLIEQGFLSGADASGEFLDQVKEYPAQFKAAGLSADEAIAVISQSVTTGVFSDKGADVIKEFGLRIREQTSATKDAMYAAFGPEFTQEILDGVNNGSISTTEALKRVATELDTTKLTAAQAQTVIADVFGGPGEDAGLDYLKSLKNVGTGIDALVDTSNVYVQRQQAMLASQKELAAVQNDLAKQFEGSSSVIDTLVNRGLTTFYALLISLVATLKEVFAPLQEIWNAFVDLGRALGLLSKEGMTARDVGEAIGNVFRALLIPTKLLWTGIAELVKGFVAWAKESDNARIALNILTFPIRALFALLTDGPAYFAGFSAAAESSIGTIARAWRRLLDRDFAGAKAEFGQIGKNAGDEFNRAFAAALAKKPVPGADTGAEPTEEEKVLKAPGGDGLTEKEKEKAAKDAEKAEKEAQARRDKADKARLDRVKEWYAEDGALLKSHNALKNQLEDRKLTDDEARRALERQKIFDDADKKYQALTGKEADYADQVLAIVAERDLQLRELTAKYDQEEEQRRQEKIDEEIARNEAATEEALAQLELDLAQGVIDEWAYEDAIYAVKKAAAERELALIKQKGAAGVVEFQKANAEKLRDEAAHLAKRKGLDEELHKFQQGLQAVKKIMGTEEIAFLGEAFGKKSALYKAFVLAQKAIALTEIAMSLQVELQENAKQSAKYPAPFNIVYLAATSGMSLVRAGIATQKVASFSSGGRTSGGGGMLDLAKLAVAPSGELLDENGFAVAGLVHKNEYVIPEWMRADPKVAQVEQWLEARRLRGYAAGGATSDGGSQAALPADAVGAPGAVDLLRELIAVQQLQNERMNTWTTKLTVIQNMYDLVPDIETYKKVNSGSGLQG